jgi:hypothetical protein
MHLPLRAPAHGGADSSGSNPATAAAATAGVHKDDVEASKAGVMMCSAWSSLTASQSYKRRRRIKAIHAICRA